MRKKKALILTVGLISIIPLSACAKESSALPVESTQVETMAETKADLDITVNGKEVETVEDELAKRASEELAKLESLEAEDRIIYSEDSEDVIAVIDEDIAEMYTQMMERSREEARAGKIKAENIEDIVVTLYEDFLTEEEQKEFISELNSLLPQSQPVSSTKPSSTSKPKDTAPAPQPTAPQEPVQEPPQTQPVSDKIDASGWDTGGTPVTVSEGIGDQSLTPEQNDRIGNIGIN